MPKGERGFDGSYGTGADFKIPDSLNGLSHSVSPISVVDATSVLARPGVIQENGVGSGKGSGGKNKKSIADLWVAWTGSSQTDPKVKEIRKKENEAKENKTKKKPKPWEE